MTVRVGAVALVSALSLHAAAVRVSAQTPSMGPVSFLSAERPALAADTTAVRAQGVGIPVVDLLREYLTAKDPQLKFYSRFVHPGRQRQAIVRSPVVL